MNIDWSKAPEGATHWQPENARLLMAAWIKMEQGYYWFQMPHMAKWVRYEGPVIHLGELVAKPEGVSQIELTKTLIRLSGDIRQPINASQAAWMAAQLEQLGYQKFEIVDDERERGVQELMDWVLSLSSKHLVRAPFKPFWEAAYDEGLRAPVKS